MVRRRCFGERSDPDGLGDVVLAAFGHLGDDARAGPQIRPEQEPAGTIHGTASPTAVAGAKLAQVVEIAREHLAVTAADPVGLREMLQVMNGSIELAGVELPAGPFRLEFLETPRHFVEVV